MNNKKTESKKCNLLIINSLGENKLIFIFF